MNALKAIVTLILISVIALALLSGPQGGSGSKQAPGQQSPPVPDLPAAGGPPAPLVILALIGVPILGLIKRLSREDVS